MLAPITPPPSLPSKNLAMNEGRNSLLGCVQPFQAYRLGSCYPTDSIIHVALIIIISDHTIYFKTNIIFVL